MMIRTILYWLFFILLSIGLIGEASFGADILHRGLAGFGLAIGASILGVAVRKVVNIRKAEKK
jgi:hypothetical protein